VKIRAVKVKAHVINPSMLEGALTRGDRRMGEAIELAWRRGARLDGWGEHIKPQIWEQAFKDTGIDLEETVHRPREIGEKLPWDHLNVKKGRTYLEKEQFRSVQQLTAMADAK
jgi:hypothetical protein